MRILKLNTRLVADTVLGYVLLGAGLVMLVTPGPGLVTLVAGLAVLGRHYRWAHRMKGAVLHRIRDAGTAVRARVTAHRAARLRVDTTAERPEREAA
ncbi:PGPGW domain-containing protein [Egicoccus sp. AB-alg2]|uniref:PGPGW domain-containing protein n=1 Tax=Egicoccus sp. AB-alg2 TaxID=3242693 RepID=UPI00359D6DE8